MSAAVGPNVGRHFIGYDSAGRTIHSSVECLTNLGQSMGATLTLRAALAATDIPLCPRCGVTVIPGKAATITTSAEKDEPTWADYLYGVGVGVTAIFLPGFLLAESGMSDVWAVVVQASWWVILIVLACLDWSDASRAVWRWTMYAVAVTFGALLLLIVGALMLGALLVDGGKEAKRIL